MEKDFSSQVVDILKSYGWQPETPTVMLKTWEAFVESCEDGFQWGFDEYCNDIRIRERIELILINKSLGKFDEFSDFLACVKQIDKKFKLLLISDVELQNTSYWWEKGVLRYARPDYAQEIYDLYGIEVRVVE